MLDQILITGISGALIIFMIMGFGMTIKISSKIKAGTPFRESIKEVLGKHIISWISTIVFTFFVLMIVAGITVSIIFE